MPGRATAATPSPSPGRFRGCSRVPGDDGEAQLHLSEYETDPGRFREVDPKDDARMAYADALFTVQQLQEWAQKYEVSWEIQLGRERGRVEASGADAAA